MRSALASLAVLVAALAVAGGGLAARDATPACRGGDLRGSFSAVYGSEGAGNISYALVVRNVSTHACFVTGIPALQLLDAKGTKIPTHATPAHPGELTAVLVTLAPGASATLTARFSPDVPGPGEQHPGRCEAVSTKLRATPSGRGSVVVPIRPPTSVCEHGSMSLSVFTKAA